MTGDSAIGGGIQRAADVQNHTLSTPFFEATHNLLPSIETHAKEAYDWFGHAADGSPKFFGYLSFGIAALGTFYIANKGLGSLMRNTNSDSTALKVVAGLAALALAFVAGNYAFDAVANKGAALRTDQDNAHRAELSQRFQKASIGVHAAEANGTIVMPFGQPNEPQLSVRPPPSAHGPK